MNKILFVLPHFNDDFVVCNSMLLNTEARCFFILPLILVARVAKDAKGGLVADPVDVPSQGNVILFFFFRNSLL